MQDSLEKKAAIIRRSIQDYATTSERADFEHFPKGSCSVASELLGRWFAEVENREVCIVSAIRENDESHAWCAVDGFVVDITADQFGLPAVIVCKESKWHESWPNTVRSPLQKPAEWQMYPLEGWCYLIADLRRKLRAIVSHEIGHAIVAIESGLSVSKISTEIGNSYVVVPDRRNASIDVQLEILVAGSIAEAAVKAAENFDKKIDIAPIGCADLKSMLGSERDVQEIVGLAATYEAKNSAVLRAVVKLKRRESKIVEFLDKVGADPRKWPKAITAEDLD